MRRESMSIVMLCLCVTFPVSIGILVKWDENRYKKNREKVEIPGHSQIISFLESCCFHFNIQSSSSAVDKKKILRWDIKLCVIIICMHTSTSLHHFLMRFKSLPFTLFCLEQKNSLVGYTTLIVCQTMHHFSISALCIQNWLLWCKKIVIFLERIF